MTSADQRPDSTIPSDLRGHFAPVSGLLAGFVAFVGVYSIGIVLSLYETRLLSLLSGALAELEALVGGSFWLFNAAHIGATRRLLVLLGPASPLERVPGVLVYLVPPTVLALAGGTLVWHTGRRHPGSAAFVRGASVGTGYLSGVVLVLGYLYTVQPFPLGPAFQTVVVGGLLYPAGFGGLGGFLVSRRTSESGDGPASPARETETRTTPTEPTVHEGGQHTGEQRPNTISSVSSPAASSSPSDRSPHFEEVLTPQVTGGRVGFVVVFAAGFTVPILALFLLFAPPLSELDVRAVSLPLFGLVFFGVVGGILLYYRMRVFVEVTDSGVEVVRNWNALRGAPQVTIPFEDITGVQASDSIRALIDEQESAVSPDQKYMVTSGSVPGIDIGYRRGVRIERETAPPVYLGSGQPSELAATIRRRVTSPEQVTSGASSESAESETAADEVRGAADATVSKTADSDEISGSVPGWSEREETRGLVAVILFAVGMVVAVVGFGASGIVVVTGVLGVMLLVGGVKAWRAERHQLATFEPTTGTVLATELATATKNRRKPLVKYEYTADGETYENDKIWPGGPMAKQMGPRLSHDYLAQYPEGEETTVYYDPADPSNAFIDRSSTKHWYAFAIVVGLGLLVYTAMGFLGVVRPPAP